MSTQPYRAEDLASTLAEIMDLQKVECLGPFQLNHLWVATFILEENINELTVHLEITVKGRQCLMIDPNHW